MKEPPSRLPVGRVLAATTATQAFSTLAILALAAMAPRAAAEIGVSAALIGYQVALVFSGAMSASLFAGGLVHRYGPVRASQVALFTTAAGALCSALGPLPALALGAFVMGVGYGLPNPAASQLLARLPSTRGMNLIFSIKQTGVPIGGLASGLVVPPLALAFGWQATMIAVATTLVALGLVLGCARGWDTDRDGSAPLLGAARASVALVWGHKPLRWLAAASFVYSGVQLCLGGFLVTYLVAEIGMSLVAAGTVLSITHGAGAIGRLCWGWLADRLKSGGLALIVNGLFAMASALAIAAASAAWPFWAIALVAASFGFSAQGWNGVYIAVIARQAPAGSIGHATGGSLAVTYSGVIFIPPAFAALHDRAGAPYALGYALLAIVTAVGIACILRARHWARR